MKLYLKMTIGLGIGLALSPFVFAGEKHEDKTESYLRLELAKRYPGSTIEFQAGSSFPSGRDANTLKSIRILSEAGTGIADYSAIYADGSTALGQLKFTAMLPTYVAMKRIRPGEKLNRGDFQLQSINVAQGLAYQYRGVMLGAKEEIDGLQARQTILEGQYPLTSGVERVPDIRRGDTVEVKILSGEIELSTMGQVQEPGYKGQNIRVLTQKTKKELVGKLTEGGIVEVKL